MTEELVENRREAADKSVTRDNSFPIDRGGGYFQILIPSPSPNSGVLPAFLPDDFRIRERVLDSTVRADAMWSAAIGIAITKAAALAWETKSESSLRSKKAQELLLSADATSISGIGGWVSYMGKQVRNFTCTNGGCYTEIIRKTGAYGSKIVGLGHLSSLRMRRTGDPEYPFIYLDRWGRQHVMKWWQVFNLVDMPDPDESFLGMGLCAAERAYQQIRKLSALELYLYEKISGSRPLALHIVNGLTRDQLMDMMSSASESQASKGMSMYMGALVATTLKPDSAPTLVTIPLAELPDGFEAAAERDRADLIYANALGLDPQDLKPMSNQQMGAGAQSEVLNQKAEGRGQAAYRQQLTHMLNQLVFDDKTQFLFTEHDYRDQKMAADVAVARGAFVSGLVDKQLITGQQGLQVLVEQGELPKAFIETGAQAGSDLSDTDKQGVIEPLNNDPTGAPQPTTQPVMQVQNPAPVQPGAPIPTAQETTSAAEPTAAADPVKKTIVDQKAQTPHSVHARHIQAGARRILRQVHGGGVVRTKDDSGGVWRYIHGHPVLIKGGSGGGGGGSGSGGGSVSGGKGKGKSKGAGATAATGTGTNAPTTPKHQKNNVPTHGAGGQSKYPTLDAYKKGQISHENALQMLQADIKTAKLAGDTKAVNTLNTQYYGLKKAGPKPSDQSLTNAPHVPSTPKVPLQGPISTTSHDAAKAAAYNITESFLSGDISKAKMDQDLGIIGAKTGHSVEQLKALAKEHDLSLQKHTPAQPTIPTSTTPKALLTAQEKIDSIAGTPVHGLAGETKYQIDQGNATFSDVNSFHMKSNEAIKNLQTQIDGADAAIASAKSAGLTPLSTIQKYKDNAIAQQEAIHALKASVDDHWKQKQASTPPPAVTTPTSTKLPLSELHNDPDVIHAAKLMSTNEWLDYDKKAKEVAAKYGIPVNDVKDSINKANQIHNPFAGFTPVKPVSSGVTAPAALSTFAAAAKHGMVENDAYKLNTLVDKHNKGLIADATYNTQMYKLAKETGKTKKDLEGIASEMGTTHAPSGSSVPKTPKMPKAGTGPGTSPSDAVKIGMQWQQQYADGKITTAQLDTHLYNVAKANGMHSGVDVKNAIAAYVKNVGPTGVIPSTGTPKTTISATIASKIAAMPPTKQDLVKLGEVYDQHGGTSSTYMMAIEAYNTKHGTFLTWSSAGPAVKEAKQEAGLLPTASFGGSGYKPLPAGSTPVAGAYAPHKPATGVGAVGAPKGKVKTDSSGNATIKELNGKDYKMNPSVSAANTWADQGFTQWHSGLTSGEKEAFIGYSKNGDGPINNFLRHGTIGDESNSFGPQKPSVVNARIKHLDDAIAKSSVHTDVVTVRGFSHAGLVQRMESGQDLTGAVFHDNAYVSTSVNTSGGFGGSVKMTIHVPKGSKGGYMDGNMHLTKYPGEAELLLGRDSNFRIVGYHRKNKYDPWNVEVEYMGTGPMPTTGTAFKAE